MRAVLDACFVTDDDFWFDKPEEILLPDYKEKNLYKDCDVQYKFQVDEKRDDVIRFHFLAVGSDDGRRALEDFLEGLLCHLRVGRSYLMSDIYNMISPIIENVVYNRVDNPVHYHGYLGGNYEGTSITVTIVKGNEIPKRTRAEIESEYNWVIQDTTMIQDGPNSHKFANQDRRNELLAEYRSTLSEEEQLAIFLHQHLCHYNHTDACSWSYEIHGVVDNWAEYAHKNYLEMAKRMIERCPDVNMIKSIITAIENTTYGLS